jgi:hypothetical protein
MPEFVRHTRLVSILSKYTNSYALQRRASPTCPKAYFRNYDKRACRKC